MPELQNVRRSLFGALAAAYAGTFLASSLKAALVTSGDLSVQAEQSYLMTSAQKVAQDCRQCCGAHGVFSTHRIADYLSLFQGLLTSERDLQLLRITAAQQLVSSSDYSPPRIGAADFAGLDDEPTWLDLFRAREGRYYEKMTAGPRSPFCNGTVFDLGHPGIPDAMALADAYAKRRALECFLNAVDDAPDVGSRTALHLAAKLFVLDYVITHAGLFLAEGHITRPTGKSLDREYMTVCQQLADHLPLLVDAFAIDEGILDLPVTCDDRSRAMAYL